MKRILLLVVCLFFFSLTAQADDGTVNSVTGDQQGAISGSNTGDFRQIWDYHPESNGNIGTMPTPGGSMPLPMMPNIPLENKTGSAGEASVAEIFSSFPSKINSEMIGTYARTLDEEKGKGAYDEVFKSANKHPYILKKFAATTELAPLAAMPKWSVEGKNHEAMGRLVFSAEDPIVYREDLALLICAKAMEMGANVIIPTGEGAEKIFKSNAKAGGVLGLLSRIFAGTMFGYGVAPGVSVTSGENKTTALPYLRVMLIRVWNLDEFLAEMDKEKRRIEEEKLQAERARQEAEQAKKTAAADDKKGFDGALAAAGEDIANCPLPNVENATKRLARARLFLGYFKSNPEKTSTERALALSTLVDAYGDLNQAVRDLRGAKDAGALEREVNRLLSSVYYEVHLRVKPENKSVYLKRAIEMAGKAGEKEVETLK